MSENKCEVELGFLMSPEEGWRIWDSAKFGGKPWWLNPTRIPSLSDIQCKCCEKPMCFLMQLYNPCNSHENAYHRSLYVYICRNQECVEKGCLKVLRCQLPKKNAFYPEDLDSVEGSSYLDAESPISPFHYGNHLCSVCGIKATSKCANCSVYYCCRDHQLEAWRNGHKEKCGLGDQSLQALYDDSVVINKVQFPLWEVDLFPEPEETESEKKAEAEQLARIVKINSAEDPENLTDKDIRDALGGRLENDSIRLHFNLTIERANTQVLRVCQWENDAILWANEETILPLDQVPKCPHCGKDRKFEFQIMPQLIYLLGSSEESRKTEYPEIDFGSLVVFTCCKSCTLPEEEPYAEEFIYYHSHYTKNDIEEVKEQFNTLYNTNVPNELTGLI